MLCERNLSMAENVAAYTKDYEPINCFYRNAVFDTAEPYKTYLEEYRAAKWKYTWRYPEGNRMMEAVSYIHDGDIVYGLGCSVYRIVLRLSLQLRIKPSGKMLTDDGRSFTEDRPDRKIFKDAGDEEEHHVVYPWELCWNS